MLPPHNGAIADLKRDGAVVLFRFRPPGPGAGPRAARSGYARPIARVRAISMTTRSGLGVGVRP
ncbi:hypothetical protein SNE510_13180 [Streptomyces sp. NE5-10]|nr:hypothetical protein SNE510_13180 [Streptomyces sp. NE5-10]